MKKVIILLALILGIEVNAQIVGGFIPLNSTKSATMGGLRVTGNTTTNKLRVGSTVAPSATLDVTGTMSVSSTGTMGSLTTSLITNAGAVSVNAATGNPVTLKVNNANILSVTGSGAALTGTMSISGASTLSGDVTSQARIVANQGTDVASAVGSITLAADGNYFEITGTSAITRISNLLWKNGSEVTLIFTSTATLTDGTANSSTDIGFELAGGATFSGSAEDLITLVLCEIGGTQRWREKCRSVN